MIGTGLGQPLFSANIVVHARAVPATPPPQKFRLPRLHHPTLNREFKWNWGRQHRGRKDDNPSELRVTFPRLSNHTHVEFRPLGVLHVPPCR
jgi:hypothetical protein